MKSNTIKQKMRSGLNQLSLRLLSPESIDKMYGNMLWYPRFLAYLVGIMSLVGFFFANVVYDNSYFDATGYVSAFAQIYMPFAYEMYITALRGKF